MAPNLQNVSATKKIMRKFVSNFEGYDKLLFGLYKGEERFLIALSTLGPVRP